MRIHKYLRTTFFTKIQCQKGIFKYIAEEIPKKSLKKKYLQMQVQNW